MKNTRMKLNLVNIITFSLTVIIIFAGSRTISRLEHSMYKLSKSAENSWREQARANIEHTIYTLNNDIKNGYVDPHDDESMVKWVRENYTGLRGTGLHSSSWVGEIGSGNIIDDQCNARMVIEKSNGVNRKIISDNFITDTENNDQIDKIISLIQEGKSSKYGDRVFYDINGVPEWIEFNYYPLFGGIDGEYSTTYGEPNGDYKRYVFVLSVKSDNINSKYTELLNNQRSAIILVYVIMFSACLFSIILMSILFYKYRYTY